MTINQQSTGVGISKINTRKLTPRHFIFKLQKIKNNVKISKETSRNEGNLTIEEYNKYYSRLY